MFRYESVTFPFEQENEGDDTKDELEDEGDEFEYEGDETRGTEDWLSKMRIGGQGGWGKGRREGERDAEWGRRSSRASVRS